MRTSPPGSTPGTAPRDRRRVRTAAALALPLCLLVGLTAARVVGSDTVRVDFTGVTFALESAGSTEAGWTPVAADWRSSDAAWTLDLADDVLLPGTPLDLRVAVRNTSGTDATVVVGLTDPDPAGTGDLFDALELTVREDGTVLATGPAASLRVTLPEPVGPRGEDVRVLDLALTLPAPGTGTGMPRTGVQVVLEGTSR
jgi:hypothetical protein